MEVRRQSLAATALWLRGGVVAGLTNARRFAQAGFNVRLRTCDWLAAVGGVRRHGT